LIEHILAAEAEDRPSNPFTHALGFIQLQATGDTKDALLADLSARVQTLEQERRPSATRAFTLQHIIDNYESGKGAENGANAFLHVGPPEPTRTDQIVYFERAVGRLMETIQNNERRGVSYHVDEEGFRKMLDINPLPEKLAKRLLKSLEATKTLSNKDLLVRQLSAQLATQAVVSSLGYTTPS
jgi:hypothetical protein